MSKRTISTESVVRRHLEVFLAQKGAGAIVEDYDEGACLYSEERIYRGKREIRGFFTEFLDALPPGAIPRFALKSLHVEGDVAYITWSIDGIVPLGTDTFVVKDGKISTQSFAMYRKAA